MITEVRQWPDGSARVDFAELPLRGASVDGAAIFMGGVITWFCLRIYRLDGGYSNVYDGVGSPFQSLVDEAKEALLCQ